MKRIKSLIIFLLSLDSFELSFIIARVFLSLLPFKSKRDFILARLKIENKSLTNFSRVSRS